MTKRPKKKRQTIALIQRVKKDNDEKKTRMCIEMSFQVDNHLQHEFSFFFFDSRRAAAYY